VENILGKTQIFTFLHSLGQKRSVNRAAKIDCGLNAVRGDTIRAKVRMDILREVDAAINKYERDEVAEAIELLRILAQTGN
jgi:hypothetical protein